jgi:serine/threonine protein kinase
MLGINLQPLVGELRATVSSTTLEDAIARYNVLDADDARNAADFIRACLHLDPEQRPSAVELMAHRWVSGADMLVDYRSVLEHLAQKTPRATKYSYKGRRTY